MAQSEEWIRYLKKVRPMMIEQHSSLFYEAPLTHDVTGESMMTGMRADKLKSPAAHPFSNTEETSLA